MKVLWLVNIVMPRIAEKLEISNTHVGGGWLTGISNGLLDNSIDLYVCSPTRDEDETKIIDIEKNLSACFYCEENGNEYNPLLKNVFSELIENVKPDIVHAFGTEFPRTFSMAEATKEKGIPYVISITGLLNPYSKKYYGSVPQSVLRFGILKKIMAPITKTQPLSIGKKDFIRRGYYENKALRLAQNVIGRTTWDYACTTQVNKMLNYYYCNEILRDQFYTECWRSKNYNKHTIIVPQMGYPIKGFEVFLEGLKIIKMYYPDVQVYVPGWNRFCMKNKFKKRIAIWCSEYDHYISQKINEYELWDNIVFCGPLNANEMRDKMLMANVFVLPSAIENSPNSLGEAMLLGLPSVAACVGGVQDLLRDKTEGFIYPYNEPYMMAYYVMKLFADVDLATKISLAAQNRAKSLYDRKRNTDNLINIYSQIVERERIIKEA